MVMYVLFRSSLGGYSGDDAMTWGEIFGARGN